MMTSTFVRRSLLTGAFLSLALSSAVSPQHVHDAPAAPARVRLGAHAVPLLTHASPILNGESRTEAYLTQPTLLADAALFNDRLVANAAISLEPLTIERGELGAGNYGEGYIDRRHPHTYLHELAVTSSARARGIAASLTLGRGFVPFGTDDPMMRPFVKFPVNHHLAQVLERLIAIAAVRAGPVAVEGGTFNGNEPVDAQDVGSIDRFGDSWAARVTIFPARGLEVQASIAEVISPELPVGGGSDQRKRSVSARYEQRSLYLLAETARTTELDQGTELYSVSSMLLETALQHRGWRPALRLERSERAEEGRAFDPFRTPWPHADTHLLGITTWTIAAARIERGIQLRRIGVAPFVELSYAHVQADTTDLFDPEQFYGSNELLTFNLGARMTLGVHRGRMGRYGVALPSH